MPIARWSPIPAHSIHLQERKLDSNGEILEMNDEYALVKFYVPTPNIWFRLDQIELAE